MLNPKSPCIGCPREDRASCASSCDALSSYRRLLDALDPEEAARARRGRVLEMGLDVFSGLAAGGGGQGRPS